jgi:hypothetical protein
VRPIQSERQVLIENQDVEALSSTRKHELQVAPVSKSIRQFDTLHFKVVFLNKGELPVEFSTENLTVIMNGEPVRLQTYEAQLQDIRNRLSFYGLKVPISYYSSYHLPFYLRFHDDQLFLRTDFNDRLDVLQAFADFEYIQAYSLKPKLVLPGAHNQGEVIIDKKLSENKIQRIMISVRIEEETHTFNFEYYQMY